MTSVWTDVEHGRRELDWTVAFGDPQDAHYLTPLGRAVAARAVVDLESFFGPRWLHRAANPVDRSTMIPLGGLLPSLMGAPAFVAAIALWAQLQLLVEQRTSGIGKLRHNLRANPVRDEFRHGIAQARLAVQAHLAGARVVLEPAKPGGGPGDLLFTRGGSDVFVEFRGLGPGDAFVTYNARHERATGLLRRLQTRHDVHFAGCLPHDPDLAWRRAVQDAAGRAHTTGKPVDVVYDGARLVVAAGPAPIGTAVSGPLHESDQGPRLLHALTRKAIQTAAAGAAWLWLEDAGALWPLSDFARYPMAKKVDTLAEAVLPLFSGHPHVLGVVLTSHLMRLDGPVDPVIEQRPSGCGFRRTMADHYVREALVVHRPLVVPEQYAMMRQLCADEPLWLDAALARLGVPGGITSLTNWALAHTAGSFGTQRRSPMGLYLPG